MITPQFGQRITKDNNLGTKYPVYGGGGVSFRTDNYNRTDEVVISRFAISKNCVRRVDGDFWLMDSGFTYSVDEETTSHRFIYHYLKSIEDVIYLCSNQSAQRNLDMSGFKDLKVPLPPLEVQCQVEDRLSSMTDYVDEVRRELELRKKQYTYAMNRLFDFSRFN